MIDLYLQGQTTLSMDGWIVGVCFGRYGMIDNDRRKRVVKGSDLDDG